MTDNTVNQLVIRDPDYENSYVTDADINVIEIDYGRSWEGYKYFAASLAFKDDDQHEEALDFEQSIMDELKHLPSDNPVLQAAEEFFATARKYYDN